MMVDLMQETEFVKVGKLYMNKNGKGTLYTKKELKELLTKNNKKVTEEAKKKTEKKVVKDVIIKKTDKANK